MTSTKIHVIHRSPGPMETPTIIGPILYLSWLQIHPWLDFIKSAAEETVTLFPAEGSERPWMVKLLPHYWTFLSLCCNTQPPLCAIWRKPSATLMLRTCQWPLSSFQHSDSGSHTKPELRWVMGGLFSTWDTHCVFLVRVCEGIC